MEIYGEAVELSIHFHSDSKQFFPRPLLLRNQCINSELSHILKRNLAIKIIKLVYPNHLTTEEMLKKMEEEKKKDEQEKKKMEEEKKK